MTRRLYHDDAYRTEFDATVLEVTPGDDGRRHVVLDASFFYPTSGGQMHDTGALGDARVVDVVERDDGTIVHVVVGPAPEVGSTVHGLIDAERRADHRQQHSGQHVLSAVFFTRLGLQTVSSRLGESGNTLDLATDALTEDQLDEIEDATNHFLWDARPVRAHQLTPDDAVAAGLRKTPKRSGPIRVIEVEGVDRCPCGGTHVANTAEVGLVVITGTEKIKGGTRVNFWCGDRALRYRRERQRWLDGVALRLTTGAEFVDATVEKLMRTSKERLRRLEAIARELVATRSEAWWDEAEDRPSGVRGVVRVLDEDEALAVPTAVRLLTKHERTFVGLITVDGDRAALTVARSDDLDLDAGSVLREVLAPIGGRGGGRPDHARGGFPASEVGAVRQNLIAVVP